MDIDKEIDIVDERLVPNLPNTDLDAPFPFPCATHNHVTFRRRAHHTCQNKNPEGPEPREQGAPAPARAWERKRHCLLPTAARKAGYGRESRGSRP
jgi:hypothetical protein